MADKVAGTDNVFVLGIKSDTDIVPMMNQAQVDSALEASLAIQRDQINDFVSDLQARADRADTLNYGSLMRHLQQECVFHLSALAAASLMEVTRMRARYGDDA